MARGTVRSGSRASSRKTAVASKPRKPAMANMIPMPGDPEPISEGCSGAVDSPESPPRTVTTRSPPDGQGSISRPGNPGPPLSRHRGMRRARILITRESRTGNSHSVRAVGPRATVRYLVRHEGPRGHNSRPPSARIPGGPVPSTREGPDTYRLLNLLVAEEYLVRLPGLGGFVCIATAPFRGWSAPCVSRSIRRRNAPAKGPVREGKGTGGPLSVLRTAAHGIPVRVNSPARGAR